MAKKDGHSADNSNNTSNQVEQGAPQEEMPDFSWAEVAPAESADAGTGEEAAPFVFESSAPQSNAQEQQGGQFSGEDIEFESWMFDAGDGQGILTPGSATSGPANAQEQIASAPVAAIPEPGDVVPAPITGREVPAPDFVNAFVQDTNVPESPVDIYGAAQQPDLDIDSLLSGIDGPPEQVSQTLPYYPEAPGSWSDQLLASVDDFSSVLLAMHGSPAPAAPAQSDQAGAVAPEQAESIAPAAEMAAPQAAEAVQPPWQLGDMPDNSFAAPAEMAHDPEAFMAQQEKHDAAPAVEDASAVPMPDYAWMDQQAAGAESSEAHDQANAGEPATEIPAPAWSPAMDENLPPWLMEVAESGVDADGTHLEAAPATLQPWNDEAHPEVAPDFSAFEAPQIAWAEAEQYEEATPVEARAAQDRPDASEPAEIAWAETEQYEEATPFQAEAAAPEIHQVEPLETVEVPATPVQAEAPEPDNVVPFEPAQQPAAAAQPASASETEEASPEGQFSGEDIEFESWMFNSGQSAPLPALAGMAQLVPAVQSMEQAVVPAHQSTESPADIEALLQQESMAAAVQEALAVEMDSVQPADESLPFWLQDRPDVEEHPGSLPSLPASEFPAMAPAATLESAQLVADAPEAAHEAEPEPAPNFTDLPPIEPFDFSTLPPVEEEESLGFSTEELTSLQPREHEPMMVTANLDVLADLLGKDKGSALLDKLTAAQTSEQALADPRLMPGVKPSVPAQPAAQVEPPVQAQSEPVAQAPVQPQDQIETDPAEVEPVDATPTGLIQEDYDGNWTATATSKLAHDTVAQIAASDSEETHASLADSTSAVGYDDLNVSPFDISELHLDAEETNTEYLTSSLIHRASDDDSQKILTGSLFAPSATGGPDYWEAPAWMADVVESENYGSDMDTSRFSASQPAVVDDDPQSTQYLTGRSGRESVAAAEPAEPVEVAEPAGEFKARVSKFKVPENPARDEPQTYEPLTPVQPVVASTAPAEQPRPSAAPVMPSNTSGPLPKLHGFEDLEQMVAVRPGEVGPLMALAVAYAQAGETEHAIYEYHRILQNRKVPAPMLQIVSGQLDEIEEEATGLPRYHQVRGDLYMKQGKYEEAIEEYNKIK